MHHLKVEVKKETQTQLTIDNTKSMEQKKDSPKKNQQANELSKDIPESVRFFSGNPTIEVTEGVIHLYKNDTHVEDKNSVSNFLTNLIINYFAAKK